MIIEKEIAYLPIKPAVKGLYYTLSSKADKFGYIVATYNTFGKIDNSTFSKYIGELIMMDFIEKETLKRKGKKGFYRINRYRLKINNSLEVPFDVYKKVEKLSFVSKGVFISLYVMASDEGYVYKTVKELQEHFSYSYESLWREVNRLYELKLIDKYKGLIKINLK